MPHYPTLLIWLQTLLEAKKTDIGEKSFLHEVCLLGSIDHFL